MNKKIFSPIFVGSLFLMSLIFFSAEPINAYRPYQRVSRLHMEGWSCTIPTGNTPIIWDNVSARYERKWLFGQCEEPATYGARSHRTVITDPNGGGCLVNNVDLCNNGRPDSPYCAELEYKWSEPKIPNSFYHTYFINHINEACLKCHETVVDANPSWIQRQDEIVAENKCSNEVVARCGDPCLKFPNPPSCPKKKCVVTPGEENLADGFTCVADNPPAPSAIGAQTAAPACCCDLVGTKNFSWCPANGQEQENCAPPGKRCVTNKNEDPSLPSDPEIAVSCAPNEGVGGLLGGLFCKPTSCGTDEVLCPASLKTACCDKMPDNSSPCGQFQAGGGTWAYCKNDSQCAAGSPGFCAAGLCCGSTQDCKSEKGVSWCQPKDSSSCGANETYCPGSKQFSSTARCCAAGATCYNQPNGVPDCAQ